VDKAVRKFIDRRKAARKLGLSANALEAHHHHHHSSAPKPHHKKKHTKKHHKATHKAHHKGHSAKAAFVRSQMSKGRSHAQALAAWKLAHR